IGKATLVKINVDHSPKLATRYQIQSIPTVILFVEGKAKRRWSGIQPEKTYRAALNEAIRSNGEEP
ncbi:MAG TPA: thioredoxin family protein, partial [Phycisphaerae bacterium]|nr:thioredoxin family protein [Phycisphaerae bacterium]